MYQLSRSQDSHADHIESGYRDTGQMESKVFRRFCEIAYDRAGINLKEGKETLVAARVGKCVRRLELDGSASYLKYLEADESGAELVHFLDAISTNHTSFYREPEHFEIYENLLEAWRKKGGHRFRVWCAASSSGEEPYTIAISSLVALDGAEADLKILATDISTKVLAKARAGIYDEQTIAPVARPRQLEFFDRTRESRSDPYKYQVKPHVRRCLVFKRLNLMESPFPMSGPFDVIFLRNVMIYFDRTTRQRLVAEVLRLLRPGGYLFVGHSEALAGHGAGVTLVTPSVYTKPGGDGRNTARRNATRGNKC